MIKALRDWWRNRAATKVDIDEALWAQAEAGLPFLARLDTPEKTRLREMAHRFIATKEWTGAQGLALTAEMQVSIALQACLPVLNLGLEAYDGWVGIVVYPGDFVIPRQTMDQDGVIHEYDDVVLGEAWDGGPVILSWFDDPEDAWGVNVVIHEFAHKLDMLNGDADGMPALHSGMAENDWQAVFSTAYDDFCRRVDSGEDTLIDPYASDDPGEFFAVLSESFFEIPDVVAGEYPALYDLLRRYYRQDPLARLTKAASASSTAAS